MVLWCVVPMAPRLCTLPFSHCTVGLLAITIHLSLVEGAYGPTCDGFDELITNANGMVCARNEACDTARCNVSESIAITLTLLSCREPRPGILVIAQDPNSGEEVQNTVVDESRSGVQLSSDTFLDLTLDQLDDAVGIAGSISLVISPLGEFTYTMLPLDRQSCLIQALVPTPVVSKTREPFPTPQPSSIPPDTGANTTCEVLAKLAADAEFFKCTSDTTKPCDTVFCNKKDFYGKDYSAVVVLLPCVTPAAVQLSMSNGEKELVNKTVAHLREVTASEPVLVITLDHFNEAIGLKVDAEVMGRKFSFLEYTVIPLDRSNCMMGDDGGSESGSVSVAETMPIFSLLPMIAYIATTVMTY